MVKETVEWINTERLRLFETRARAETQRTARLTLPPIVNEIIEEARDVHQLIPIAYQMRDKYAAMREWMNTVQAAMDNEDPKAVARYKKLLSAVSSDIDRAMGNTDAGKVSLTISNGWPSISLALGTIDNIVKKFGMRSMLNKHIFSGHGDKGIKKLLRMFDIERTSVGFEAMEYMRGKK
ncbi:MAG: hypothetical protein CVV05_17350 [Gammaproteobacteria bacterium HGW-Gammaproteobacteria-1]|nr:MAG: hypothetical protein CVV05_17350 [Gammaproteobacteria bacterium HGW-Gammaproteobacteria-1]